jgi:peptidoglycan/LPS O-acetylase OafA/YrhL
MWMTNENRLATTHVIPYRPEIDGLRGLAVTLVVLVHAFPGYMKNGFIGVDIFFVISGFLITGILLTQLQGGSFSLRDFYIRRANRIFPALILVLTACIGFGWLSLYASEFKLLGRSVAGGAGFVANINAYLEGGYWDIAAKLKPLLHLWSLGVEEQFYLIWPALLFAAWTRHFNLAIVIIVLITTSLAWNLWSIGIDQPAAFYLPFSRLWELLAGAALAYFGGSPPAGIAETLVPSRILSNVCAFLGFALIIAGLADHFPSQEFPGKYAILPVLGTVLIIAAGLA